MRADAPCGGFRTVVSPICYWLTTVLIFCYFAFGSLLRFHTILAGSLHRQIDWKDDSSEPIPGEKHGARQILSEIVPSHAGLMLAFAGFLRWPLEDVSP